MRKMLIVFILLVSPLSRAEEICNPDCKSQFIRVDIAENALNPAAVGGLLPALETLSGSQFLKTALERKFPVDPISFPHSAETCKREKSEGDPTFATIDCDARDICSNPKYKGEVREKLCFKLPCPLFEGNLQVGKCGPVTDIHMTRISFPTDIQIEKIDFTPTKVEFKDNVANLCFLMKDLSIKLGTNIDVDSSETRLADKVLQISNVNPRLNKPTGLCLSANVNLSSQTPITNVKLTTPDKNPFINDDILRAAAQKMVLKGMGGYKHEDLEAIKSELFPVILNPIRDPLEEVLKDKLGKVFEEQIQKVIRPFRSDSLSIDGSTYTSELGVANLEVRDQVSKLECAFSKAAGERVSADHPCIGLSIGSRPLTTDLDETFLTPFFQLDALRRMLEKKVVTSEAIKQRLLAMKEVAKREALDPKSPLPADLKESSRRSNIKRSLEQLDALVAKIDKAQMESQIIKVIEIQNGINGGNFPSSVGLVLPNLCGPEASPHANRKIPGCPIQTYIDLQEFDKVLAGMWKSGQLCMEGSGDYRPVLDAAGKPVYNKHGEPEVKGGCKMNLNGLGCYVQHPPKLTYDRKSKQYKVDLSLKGCYHGGKIFGLGKFGADFKVDLAFQPKVCGAGDLCIDKPKVKWAVAPGSCRLAICKESWLSSRVISSIDESITEALKDTLKIPLASGIAGLSGLPIRAEGRVDAGPGYFGICLELKKGSRPE